MVLVEMVPADGSEQAEVELAVEQARLFAARMIACAEAVEATDDLHPV